MKIAVATPIRGGNDASPVALGYARLLWKLAKRMPTADPIFTYSLDTVRARNRLAAHVLRGFPDVESVLWLDDDNYFENPDDGIDVLGEMLATGLDIIGAPYTTKYPPLRLVHQRLQGVQPDERGILEVEGLGFGMTFTSRRCLELMTGAARLYTDHPKPHVIGDIFGQLYKGEGSDAVLLSEDFSFCKRWRELGGKVWLYGGAGVVMHAGAHASSAREMPGGIVRG